MADLIERDYLIRKFEDTGPPAVSEMGKGFDLGIAAALRVVKSAPAVNRWIPVEDALPEEGTRVIAVVDGESREAIFSYNAFHGSNFYRDQCDIERWMPMPSAYEPPEEGDNDA